jgi:hypothetical protein
VLSATVLFLLPNRWAVGFCDVEAWQPLVVVLARGCRNRLNRLVWWWSRRTGRSIPWRPPAGDLLVPVEWLLGTTGRLASKLMDKTAGVFRAHAEKETEKRVTDHTKANRNLGGGFWQMEYFQPDFCHHSLRAALCLESAVMRNAPE